MRIDKNFDNDSVRKAYDKILENESRVDEGPAKSKILKWTKELKQVAKDFKAYQLEIAEYYNTLQGVIDGKTSLEEKIVDLEALQEEVGRRKSKVRPTAQGLFDDLYTQITRFLEGYIQMDNEGR